MGGKDARAEKYQQQIVQWYAQALESDDASKDSRYKWCNTTESF